MKKILIAGAAFAALTSASYAADPLGAQVDVWSGFFAGIQGGYASGEYDVTDPPVDGLEAEGGFGGLYYGRNWQNGNWVLGLDGSISFADIQDGDTDVGLDIDAFSASRVRVGYAFDNVLIFAAAGISLAHVESRDATDDDDFWAKGFTVGAGVETKLSEHWSARLEYLYIDYGEEEITVNSDLLEIDYNDINIVRGGIAYHF